MSQPGRRPLIGDPPHLPNAACRPADASVQAARAALDLFFGPAGERPRDAEQRDTEAKTICAACPELHACRTYALDHPHDIGDQAAPHDNRKSVTYVGQIIGGLNFRERWAIRDGRPAPQPRLRVVHNPGRGNRTLTPIRHGTIAGLSAHYRRGDLPACEPCKQADAEYQQRRRQKAQTVTARTYDDAQRQTARPQRTRT